MYDEKCNCIVNPYFKYELAIGVIAFIIVAIIITRIIENKYKKVKGKNGRKK
jgi:hypothetical protein